MSIEELAARLRNGEIEEDALVEYADEYARAQVIFRNKKDD
ncbi:MAG TPA: hypothetical protein VG317_15540 [Pseudonocardiaceae bacterium]|jgi:hypothetical protein|nr:hypothetical protein [Pseudonocardiaceae bacterium]